MYKYYTLTAEIDGHKEIIFGSYIYSDTQYELECERSSLKRDGYKSIKIERTMTPDAPDREVYPSLYA